MGLKRKMLLCLDVCKIQGSLAWLRSGILFHPPFTSLSPNLVISHPRDPENNQNFKKPILSPCLEFFFKDLFQDSNGPDGQGGPQALVHFFSHTASSSTAGTLHDSLFHGEQEHTEWLAPWQSAFGGTGLWDTRAGAPQHFCW